MLNASIKGQQDAELITSKTNLPVSIRERLVGVADADQDFANSCYSPEGVPHHQFLVASRNGRVFVIAIEHGGAMYYWNRVRVFWMSKERLLIFGRSNKEIDES